MEMSPTIKLKNEEMSLYEFARWASLIEAVELIAHKLEDKHINFNSKQALGYLKPLDIQDFVNTRTDSMLFTIEKAKEFEKNNLQVFFDTNNISSNRIKSDFGLPL